MSMTPEQVRDAWVSVGGLAYVPKHPAMPVGLLSESGWQIEYDMGFRVWRVWSPVAYWATHKVEAADMTPCEFKRIAMVAVGVKADAWRIPE